MVVVSVDPAGTEAKDLLWRLMQLYLHDYSEFDGSLPAENGEYAYGFFEAYWRPPRVRFPFLIRVDGQIGGFALARVLDNGRFSMAEFFVLRAWRRQGVGRAAARLIFNRFGGPWDVTEHPTNLPAQAFWRKVIGELTGGDFRDRSGVLLAWQQFELPATPPSGPQPGNAEGAGRP